MDLQHRRESENRNTRIALLIQYDGSRFNGWQIQTSERTVQSEIENALEVLLRSHYRIISSSRTDAGVHALGQVAHLDLEKKIELRRLCIGLNGILEKDVSIKNAYIVNNNFHARFSVINREYLYYIYNHFQRSPFMKSRALWINYKLDIEYIKKVTGFLIGEKDFASFCKKKSSDVKTIRRIDEFEITQKNELIIFRIKGNAFLHNMIRIMIGTILDMFKNKKDPEYIQEIINHKDRDYSGITVSPCGLYLNKVNYYPSLNTMESAY